MQLLPFGDVVVTGRNGDSARARIVLHVYGAGGPERYSVPADHHIGEVNRQPLPPAGRHPSRSHDLGRYLRSGRQNNSPLHCDIMKQYGRKFFARRLGRGDDIKCFHDQTGAGRDGRG